VSGISETDNCQDGKKGDNSALESPHSNILMKGEITPADLMKNLNVLLERMHTGVDMIKAGVCERLARRYSSSYEPDAAALMASAVGNELFFERASDAGGYNFAVNNVKAIEDELARIQADEKIREAVTNALWVLVDCSELMGHDALVSSLQHIQRSKEMGILLQSDKIKTAESFLEFAKAFYESKSD